MMRSLVLVLLLAFPALADPGARFADSLNARRKADFQAVCTTAFWTSPQDSAADLFGQAAGKSFTIAESGRLQEGHRMVVVYTVANPEPVDEIYVYFVEGMADGVDEDQGHIKAFLEGKAPAHLVLAELPGDESLDEAGRGLEQSAEFRLFSEDLKAPLQRSSHVLEGMSRGVVLWSDGTRTVAAYFHRPEDRWEPYEWSTTPSNRPLFVELADPEE
ncbi:MAG: hypothetical protein KC910_07360 [Candidatus Eremiobacteraeota bacterium]|nr:hypothetical protein [Candidatus Eremiobacteraeota bacterium]